MRSEPLRRGAPKRADHYWARLDELLKPAGRVLLVGLKEPWEHWTVLTDVTPRTLRFLDSIAIKVARRADFSIGEGGTPLIHAPRLGARLGVDLHLKYEGLNPTGSFKDRGMTTALSAAKQDGAQAVICASTGNTSASAAAYAARAGIRCVVVIPGGKVALGKLAQAQVAGAQVVQIDGSFDDALRMVRVMSEAVLKPSN